MPTKISVRGSDPNPSSRAFTWPVLEAGNGSYTNGIYSVVCEEKERGRSLSLTHTVRDAPLLNEWMVSGKTSFVCSVAAPCSMYRKLHVSSSQEQFIEWSQSDLGEYPMFTPMIVARESIVHVVNSESNGLNQIWDKKEFRLPKGARVAVGATFKLRSGINGILHFILDDKLGSGRYRVEPSPEDGFIFKVYLAPDLHHHLRYQRGDLVGTNIMTGVVTAALNLLQREYNRDDSEHDGESWRSFRNLIDLASLLDEQDLGHWSERNFKPEMAATGLYPHKLSAEDDQ